MRKLITLLPVTTGGAGAASAAGKGTLNFGAIQLRREVASDTVLLQLNITPTTIATSTTVQVLIQGSLDGVNFYNLTGGAFTSVTVASATLAVETLSISGPLPYYLRAQLDITNTGADTTTSVTASVFAQVTLEADESFAM